MLWLWQPPNNDKVNSVVVVRRASLPPWIWVVDLSNNQTNNLTSVRQSVVKTTRRSNFTIHSHGLSSNLCFRPAIHSFGTRYHSVPTL